MPLLLGTSPNQVPTNGDLGTLAFMDANMVNITGGAATLTDLTATNPYNDTAISNVLPSLNLDFANSKSLDPRVTFSRASTATYYDGKTVAKAEENLLTYSQDFTNALWVKNRTRVVANSAPAPDGTPTAALIIEDTNTGDHNVGATQAPTSSDILTFSFYAKANTRSWAWAYFNGYSSGSAWFDLANGSVGTVENGVTATITAAGSGWYRCTLTKKNATSSGSLILNMTTGNGATSYAGDGVSSIYLWGVQLEARSSVTAYTPTTSSKITNYIPVLQTAAINMPVFDHNPLTGESLGLRIEESRTNLLTYSSEFDNAAWAKNNATITANAIVAPDGTLTGDKLVMNTGVSAGGATSDGLYKIAAITSDTYTYSIYAKAGEFSTLRVRESVNVGAFLDVNLLTGAITNGSAAQFVSAAAQSVGNGWWRISWTSPSGMTAAIKYLFRAASTGDGTSGIYIWGAQLEAGAFPTSYIPTTSAQVTRSAENAYMSGTNFSSWYNQSEGTLAAESRTSSTGGCIVNTTNNTDYNWISYYYENNEIKTRVMTNSSLDVELNSGVRPVDSFYKGAVAYKANSFAACYAGYLMTDTNGNVPLATAMYIGRIYWGGFYLNGHIKRITYFPKRLTDAELQEMTK